MAKAADIDLDPAEPYGQAGARIVATRARELFAEAGGVLDTSDIERVHDMRVASRRLRAVLEIFAPAFPKRQYRDVLADVKRIADALGARRDPDVHIAAMERFAAAVGEMQRPGIEALVAELREEQERGNAVLAAELERMRGSDLEGRLAALVAAAAPRPPETEEAGDAQDAAAAPAGDPAAPAGAPEDDRAATAVPVAVAVETDPPHPLVPDPEPAVQEVHAHGEEQQVGGG